MDLAASLHEHLRELEERLLRPDARRSLQALDELLSDEFVEFASDGDLLRAAYAGVMPVVLVSARSSIIAIASVLGGRYRLSLCPSVHAFGNSH